jgi:hypothetical protein
MRKGTERREEGCSAISNTCWASTVNQQLLVFDFSPFLATGRARSAAGNYREHILANLIASFHALRTHGRKQLQNLLVVVKGRWKETEISVTVEQTARQRHQTSEGELAARTKHRHRPIVPIPLSEVQGVEPALKLVVVSSQYY